MEFENHFMKLTEKGYQPEQTKAWEGIFAQGNGYLHIRGSFEEGLKAARQDEEYMRLPANVTVEKPRHPRSKCGTYIPGITGNHPLLREEAVNLPNPLCFTVQDGEERLDLDESSIREYRRSLDLEDGTLERDFLWQIAEGVLRCRYRRFVSRSCSHLLEQEMTFEAVQGNHSLEFVSDIDTNVRTNGYQHLVKTEKKAKENQILVWIQTDNQDEAAMCSITEAAKDGMKFLPGEKGVAAAGVLAEGEKVQIRKLTYVCTSRDPDALADLPAEAEAGVWEARKNRETLEAEHRKLWRELWDGCRIEIEGDDLAQEAVNFSMYHLLRCGNLCDDRVAICAKGLAGEAYFGHFFWDTEVYLMPFYLHTMEKAARNLAGFRIQTLPGAMENARRNGYHGAKYPWESSVTGEEQCPNWQYADHEIHINADVVYGLWNYYQMTKDPEFLRQAAPVFTETTRYWLDRAVVGADGRTQIRGVMGPDEYICFCDNNAYTNAMVKKALGWTLEVLKLLKEQEPRLYQKLNPEETLEAQIEKVRKGIRLRREENGLIYQCDHFEDYEEPEFDRWWTDRTKPYGACVSQERNYRTKSLKQADVLMLPYLFPQDFTDEEIEENYRYYIPYTTHDSSLSCIIHSILCNRIGREEEACELFHRACRIDLDETKGGAAEGIHIANCGGIWQAVVYGFGGMPRILDEKAGFQPKLPKHWKSLNIRVRDHGKIRKFQIRENQVTETKGE